MAQRLILPVNDMRFMVGYKVAIYKKEWGFVHHGIDCESVSGARHIRSLGNGVVHSCGMDGATEKDRMGLCVVVVYPDVQLLSGKTINIACRMQHFDSILCKAGQAVKAGDVLGMYGNTGRYSSGPHLHLELDIDITYPANAFGVSSGGNVIKHGTVDSTIDPTTVWYVGVGQSIVAAADWVRQGWSDAKDTAIPKLAQVGVQAPPSPQAPSTNTPDYKALYEKEKARADAEKARADAAEQLHTQIRTILK